MTITKETLKTRMLADISNDYDKSEGSFFFDAIAPVAIELEKSYSSQDTILEHAFVDTATGAYLDRKCAELGLSRKAATKATGKVQITGAIGATVQKGISVATELVTFVTTESAIIGESGTALVSVECEDNGSIGNVAANAIKYFPITIEGLIAVTNPETFTSGYDAETDKGLRDRYHDKVNTPSTSGNASHYEQWAKSVTGVGGAKIFPTWNGPGTVKVVICDSNKRAADSQLVASVAAYIETQRPVGATVTTESVAEKNIDITASIVILGNTTTIEQVNSSFQSEINAYFKETALNQTYISYARIGSILYDIYGVMDYSDLELNGEARNVILSDTELPVIGTVVLS
ncbi:baseplate J/gp47 family protein [Clostridium aminobutyricum]|uniref:Baseplate J/gp47 family protein n=1 Tax=Clostridium aminobutyricum TaxID=33953 RepID=A0A939D8G8_CLOAM|nr:baseplate J/gp47 family protein [Clostridium aminobutyricum]MBN7773162.1 baseplate J/gp47 family protein [Clostridium aminobutyricum]